MSITPYRLLAGEYIMPKCQNKNVKINIKTQQNQKAEGKVKFRPKDLTNDTKVHMLQ